MNKDIIEITVVFSFESAEVARQMSKAMTDAAIELKGKAFYLHSQGDSRAEDVLIASSELVGAARHIIGAAELQPLDDK